MKRSNMSASTLQIILIITIVVATAAGVGGFLFIRGLLVQKANETAVVAAEAAGSQNNIDSLKQASLQLDKYANAEQKASDMVASAAKYQDQIILDITAIAAQSGISVQQISFSTDAAPTTTPGPVGGTGATTPVTVGLPAGIVQKTASITLANPIRYDNWLLFIRRIEANSMNMQIARISASNTGQSSGGYSLINSDAFTIGVYVRQ